MTIEESVKYIEANRETLNVDVPIEFIKYWKISHPNNISPQYADQWTIFLYVLQRRLIPNSRSIFLIGEPELHKHFTAWQIGLTLTYMTKNGLMNIAPFELLDIEALGTRKFEVKKL